jgi:gliding motility-associated-like protein
LKNNATNAVFTIHYHSFKIAFSTFARCIFLIQKNQPKFKVQLEANKMKKAFFVMATLLCTSLSAQNITSNFDSRNEGWQTRDYPSGVAPSQSYRTTGGNPTGHISAKDGFPLPGSTVYFVAPAKFLGNKSWAYNNTLSFDLKIETGSFFYEDDVILEGNGITLAYDMPNNPTTSWTTFSCTLNETSGWKVGTRLGAVATKAQIQSVLCDLTKLWIRGEFFSNFLVSDEGFLDNVTLGVTACTANVLTQTQTICTGQSVTFNGKTYNRTGVFTDTIKRCYPQCDSVINLNLTVVNALRTAQNPTICSGNSLKVGNNTYTQSGIYRDTLKSVTNCDSIITTNLVVSPPLTSTQYFTICDVESILVGTKRYTQAGIYRDTFSATNGCQTITIIELTVNKSYTSGQNISICPNSSYRIGANTYTQAGIYQDILKTTKGCDSIVTTTLSIKNAFERTQVINRCDGASYAINNKIYTQSGIYKDTFRTLQGCDSIVTTDLTVNPPYSKTQILTICQGDVVKIGTKTYAQSGNYRDTLKTVNNCDSIFITNLTVRGPLSITQDLSICEGDFVRIGTKTYNQTGIYRDTLKSRTVCDSIVTTNLTVVKAVLRTQNAAICPNSVYTFNGKNYTQAGIFKDTVKTFRGCDSVITTIAVVLNNVSSKTEKIMLCGGQTYAINGKTYAQTGIYRDTFRTFQGCDSIIITDLTIFPIYSKTQDVSICQGDVIRIGTKTYAQSGNYRDTLKTVNNCDSIFITNLTVRGPLSITQDLSICEGDFVRIGTKTYNQTGIYRDTLKSRTVCDSIVTTNLTVVKAVLKTQNAAICPNAVFTFNGKNYRQAGIFKDTVKTFLGCDSVITTIAVVLNNVSSKTEKIMLCGGRTYAINGKTYAQTGIYRDTFRTFQGCDSIIITDLMIFPIYSKTQDVSICQGDVIRIGTKTYAQSGIYRDTLKTVNNCDSIFITNLTVRGPLSIAQDLSICEGDFVRIGTKTYNQTGIYRDTLKARNVCDSIVTTNLTVVKAVLKTQNVAICPNSVYTLNGKNYTQAGVYRDTLKSVRGCDSVFVTTTLSLIGPLSISSFIYICKGDFVKIGTKTYNLAGIYRDTFKTSKGCDSILITNLTILPERKRVIDTTICAGKTVVFNLNSYNKSGNFSDTIRVNSQCDSILTINLTVKPYPIVKKSVVLCANDSTVVNGRLFTKTGVFRDTISAVNNCAEIIEWTVSKSTLQLMMGADATIELGDSIQLDPSVFGAQNVLWTWQKSPYLNCLVCPKPIARPLQTTIFSLTVKDTTTNCSVKEVQKITVKPCESIFLPTAFSPNNDGANDYFSVFASGCVRKVLKMKLFNRWGVMVFSKENFLPNNEKNGWDGMMNDTQLPPDVYVYAIELELGDGKTKVFSGDVTLLR